MTRTEVFHFFSASSQRASSTAVLNRMCLYKLYFCATPCRYSCQSVLVSTCRSDMDEFDVILQEFLPGQDTCVSNPDSVRRSRSTRDSRLCRHGQPQARFCLSRRLRGKTIANGHWKYWGAVGWCVSPRSPHSLLHLPSQQHPGYLLSSLQYPLRLVFPSSLFRIVSLAYHVPSIMTISTTIRTANDAHPSALTSNTARLFQNHEVLALVPLQ